VYTRRGIHPPLISHVHPSSSVKLSLLAVPCRRLYVTPTSHNTRTINMARSRRNRLRPFAQVKEGTIRSVPVGQSPPLLSLSSTAIGKYSHSDSPAQSETFQRLPKNSNTHHLRHVGTFCDGYLEVSGPHPTTMHQHLDSHHQSTCKMYTSCNSPSCFRTNRLARFGDSACPIPRVSLRLPNDFRDREAPRTQR